MFFEEPVGTVFYRSQDALENFRIRVTIRKVIFGATWDNKSSQSQHHVAPKQTPIDKSLQEETRVFSWQEKVFSKPELHSLSDLNNCVTVFEKSAHEKLTSMSTEERQGHGHRLFSRVDAEIKDTGKAFDSILDDPSIPETYLAERMRRSVYRPRKPKIADLNMLQRPGGNLVGFFPASRRIGNTPSTVMHLMADLSAENQIQNGEIVEDAYLLCAIRVDSDGLMAVEPDFNAFKKPYLIQMEVGSRGMYEYYIEDASERMNRADVEKERQIFQALLRRHHETNALIVGNSFNNICAKSELRINILGEIVYVEGFEYDNLFVHYILQMPPDWSSPEITDESFHCTTQMSQYGKNKRCIFRCPFEWNCLCNLSEKQPEQFFFPWPKLFFEVVSLDSWNRYRVEGYGSLDIPTNPSRSDHLVHTWRPVGYNILSHLRRYFIGGSPELDDMTYTSIPSDFQGKELSRYGFQTVPSGRLLVRLQTVFQQSGSGISDLTNVPEESQHDMFFRKDLPDFSRLDDNRGVESVLKAFKRARNRLLAARGLAVISDAD